jgi:thioredoxin 2
MRQFVCPTCNAVNRSPQAKDAAAAKCGRCGEKLFTGHPVEVTSSQVDAHLRSTGGGGVLLDVGARSCGPRKAMAPQFAAAAPRAGRASVLKLNCDTGAQAASALAASGFPAVLLFVDGQVVARRAGAMTAAQIKTWTRQALARTNG